MDLIAIDGHKPKRMTPKRERQIYRLLNDVTGILDKDTLVKVLSVNEGPEKGPDFLAVNKKGHLLLGEVKRGGLPSSAWAQAKQYAKRFAKLREKQLDEELAKAGKRGRIRMALKGFLNERARRAFLNPSRRKLQLVFVAEHFGDHILRRATHATLGAGLRARVTDVKCVELRTYRVHGGGSFAVASVVGGRRRRLRR